MSVKNWYKLRLVGTVPGNAAWAMLTTKRRTAACQ